MMLVAEQKVKVPSSHCDSRVRTVCADVMNLLKDQVRAMTPQVLSHLADDLKCNFNFIICQLSIILVSNC